MQGIISIQCMLQGTKPFNNNEQETNVQHPIRSPKSYQKHPYHHFIGFGRTVIEIYKNNISCIVLEYINDQASNRDETNQSGVLVGKQLMAEAPSNLLFCLRSVCYIIRKLRSFLVHLLDLQFIILFG